MQRSESWQKRQERLKSLRRALVKRHKAMIAALAEDLGRPAAETELVEYLPVITEIDTAIAHLRKWASPHSVSTPFVFFGMKSQILPQPKGVCLIMAPWNYPASLVIGPLISAIAAGNTAIVKPSEFAPATVNYLRELFEDAFEDNVVQIAEGGPEMANALLEQPVDHIFFTGSPEIGRIVMAAAARGPTSVTLELGGKSPAYIHHTADLDDAIGKLVWGKFINAGQTCIAPDYLLIDRAIAPQVKEKLTARIQEVFPSEIQRNQRGNDYSAIINERHVQRIAAMLDDAKQSGANILIGGHVDSAARFIAPTVIDNVTPEMQICREEIFGPLLPVHLVEGPDEAIAHINAAPPPLSSYVFTKDKAIADRYLTEAPAGGSCVNHTLVQFANENLPFGGIGPSGIGRSHGKAGFETFSNLRAVVRDRFSMTHRFFPPYTKSIKAQLGALLKLKGAA